jgi:hypothetical protein
MVKPAMSDRDFVGFGRDWQVTVGTEHAGILTRRGTDGGRELRKLLVACKAARPLPGGAENSCRSHFQRDRRFAEWSGQSVQKGTPRNPCEETRLSLRPSSVGFLDVLLEIHEESAIDRQVLWCLTSAP